MASIHDFTADDINGVARSLERRGAGVGLRVGVKDEYELALLGYCPDVDWTRRIALRSVSGSSMICTSDAMGWEIVVLDRPGIGPDSCRVRAIRKLESEVRVQP